MELLLEAGAPVNCPVTEDSSMPLHKACAGSKPGHLACVKLLLNADADVHALNKWRETPLLTAANHGQSGAVQALLAADADPCKCTDTGWSPLSIAAYKGHDEVVRLLLEDGAPTEEEDPTLSALLQAATKGLTDTVDLLLRHGADHTVTTKKGDTALSILVEQNLIDAAVDMVTMYNASIPRCSRDRKKVQRARLLINFRMKQIEREGKTSKNDSDSCETDEDDSTTNAAVAQHLESGSASSGSKGKPKKNKKSNNVLAEEIAMAAQEALLLELAQEDEKARKEEAEANSKRAKKRKKKERERQQKIKDEEERRQRQEKEAQERERIRKEKEEKLRQERENKLKEEREREVQKMMDLERKLAAQRKELAQREKRERAAKLEERGTGSVSPSLPRSSKSEKKSKNIKKATATTDPTPNRRIVSPKTEIKPSVPLATGRRWETASKRLTSGNQNTGSASSVQCKFSHQPLSPSVKTGSNTTFSSSTRFTVDDFSQGLSRSRPNEPIQRAAELPQAVNDINMNVAFSQIRSVEHPAVTVQRQEKILELLRSCCEIISDICIVKRAIYRWILRASHDDSAFLDPLIPSWTDTDKLVVYFQRQFIAETRRRPLLFPGMESLKEAGSSVATLCQHFASQVFEFRRQIEEVIPSDWTDTAIGMNISGDNMAANGKVVVSWANGAKVSLPSFLFAALRGRYIGPPSRLLTTIFVARIWYDSLRSIVTDTPMEFRLLPSTQSTLAMEAGVTAELLTDPFSVLNGNIFWGHFENIDSLFGGRKPFSNDLAGTEELGRRGGSLSVFLPLDATVASQYVKRMIDVLVAATLSGVPLSFALFIRRDCFGDFTSDPSWNDLYFFDSRLSQKETYSYVSRVEILRSGEHSFLAGDSRHVCSETSLFVLLQNDAGRLRFSISNPSAARILGTLCEDLAPTAAITDIGFSSDVCSHGTPITPHSQGCYFEVINPLNSEQHRILQSDIGTVGGKPTFTTAPFSPQSDGAPKNTRRGRLFDLEDNVDEDQGNDEISEILNWDDLTAGLFQNNLAADIDIEAIGLGISGPHTSRSLNSGNPRPGMFG